jgi:catechol 2,3-dioxygenase-like lactoylglutathione lyase family enzyme
MIKVFRLGYAEFATGNPDGMLHYYTEIMGLNVVERAGDGTAYLSIGLDHHNVVVRPGSESRIAAVGWQLDGKMTLAEVARALREHGISSEIRHDARPGIAELLEVQDPAGYTLHLYTQMKMPAPGYGKSGIVPLKLGHLALCAPDARKTVAFYRDILNFWETDWLYDRANFLTCNHDHHTLNIVQSDRSVMHHIAFELRDATHHQQAAEFLIKNGIVTGWGPSRHTAGHNYAAYHRNPDQQIVELYSGMDVFIPELGIMEPRPWHEDFPQKPKRWQSGDGWGTSFNFNWEIALPAGS